MNGPRAIAAVTVVLGGEAEAQARMASAGGAPA
jgi:hypothetical protein